MYAQLGEGSWREQLAQLEEHDDPQLAARARLPEVPEHTFVEMLAVVAAAPFELERLILLKARA